MYLDKLYNKLFSENNLEGIEVLNRELRLFAEDPSTQLQQLLNTIRVKQSKGEDVSAEQAQVKQLQAQINGGGSKNPLANFDLNKGISKVSNTVGNVTNLTRTVGFLGNAIKDIGGLFMGK